MKGRDFRYNDSYESIDRESFDPTLIDVLSRTLKRQRTGLGAITQCFVSKFMRSCMFTTGKV